MNTEQQLLDYGRIEKAIEYITINQAYQPSLSDIAYAVKMSPNHFQRLFTRWAGITPKKFLQYITLEKSKERLAFGDKLPEEALQAGLSDTGRLHDLIIKFEGMTQAQFRESGQGKVIFYDLYPSIFGLFLLGVTEEGHICSLDFTDDLEITVAEWKNKWHKGQLVRSNEKTAPLAEKIISPKPGTEIIIAPAGTDFQLKVWEALLKIPFGNIVSYKTIAEASGNPNALQAVGSAIGSNPVAYIVPCHRVIRRAGNISQYRWGQTRKMALIAWEACLTDNTPDNY